MFHKGAPIKDNSGLLAGDGAETRVARFEDMDDMESKREALKGMIREWIRMKDEQ